MSDDEYLEKSPFGGTFIVEIDGDPVGRFTEVSGLEVSVAVEEIAEGGVNGYVHKLPGRMSWPNIRLARGVTQNDAFLAWLNRSSGEGFAGAGHKLDRRTVAITMTGLDGTRLRTWELEGAFAVSWSGPRFASTSDEMLTEELEIAHHGFRAREV